MNDIPLSEYGRRSTKPSPINRLMTEFSSGFRDGVDLNLGGGYINEQTIPREQILASLDRVLHDPRRHHQPLNYGGPTGSTNLRTAIRRFLIDGHISGMTEQVLASREIIVGSSGATSLLESIAHVLPRGIAITTDPMYYVYTEFLERCGFDVVTVPEDEDGMRTDLLAEKLAGLGDRAEEVRFFYVVTVNNPSCTILANSRRREIIATAWRLSQRLGRKVPVFFDRAYEELIHDGQDVTIETGFRNDPGGIVYEIGTLSKVLAPALRIGYMIGQGGDFLRAMVQRTSDTGFSAPLVNQEICSLILERHIAGQLSRVRAGYTSKGQAVRSWLDGLLGDELEMVRGGRAGFYYYLTLRHTETHEQSAFFRYLTRTTGEPETDAPNGELGARVVYIPGQYCVHPRGDLARIGRRQLRIAYGFEDLDSIHRGLGLMAEAIRYARQREMVPQQA